MTPPELAQLRREIDAIDDGVHDLLLRRSQLVERLIAAKAAAGGVAAALALRPGREAQVLRRLLGRHSGRFPAPALVRLWREIMGAFTLLQTPMKVAICRPADQPGYWDLARDHFGSQIPLVAHDSAAQVLSEVRADPRVLGVLPAPAEDEQTPWWPLLAGGEAATPNVVARLPFVPTGNARARGVSALVLARIEAEASGDDVSLLMIEAPGDVSRGRLSAALGKAGLPPYVSALGAVRGGLRYYLVEVPVFVPDGDPRLAAFDAALETPQARIVCIGAYAAPPRL